MDRFNDLQRQGFMKFRKPKAQKIALPTVACDDCLNWHPKGRHTTPLGLRRERAVARGTPNVQRVI